MNFDTHKNYTGHSGETIVKIVKENSNLAYQALSQAKLHHSLSRRKAAGTESE